MTLEAMAMAAMKVFDVAVEASSDPAPDFEAAQHALDHVALLVQRLPPLTYHQDRQQNEAHKADRKRQAV